MMMLGSLLAWSGKVVIILGVAWALDRILPAMKPSRRHRLWMVALLGAALVPLLSIVAPRWSVDFLSRRVASSTRSF